jgi:hypothetical protein
MIYIRYFFRYRLWKVYFWVWRTDCKNDLWLIKSCIKASIVNRRLIGFKGLEEIRRGN